MSRLMAFGIWAACFCTLQSLGSDWAWTGAVSANWSNKANWTTASAAATPQPGDTVRLAAGVFNPQNQDIPSLSIRGLVLTANITSGTTVSGSAIALGEDGLQFQAGAATFTFATPFVLTAQQTWQIPPLQTLTLAGSLSASLPVFTATGASNTGTGELIGVSPLAGLVRGMPASASHIASTWVQSVSGSTVTLTRPALLATTAPVDFTSCWIVAGGGTLDVSSADGANLNAPLLIRSGTVRWSAVTRLNGGAILDRTATLELKRGSGMVAIPRGIVSLNGLLSGETETQSPALLVHAGDALTIPTAAGEALNTNTGGGTENAFRVSGGGSVSFLPTGLPPAFSTASLRLEGGHTTCKTLPLQPEANPSSASGVVEFRDTAEFTIPRNDSIAVTQSDGRVTPAGLVATSFLERYGPRHVSVRNGAATLTIESGALFQNNLHPADDYILVGGGATLNIAGADDSAIFRLGRRSGGAISANGNLGRFDVKGGQVYFHADAGGASLAVFPTQAGFTLALNGGIFNGNRCGDFFGAFRVLDASPGLARVDNLKLAGTGDTFWGAGVLEKINVADHADGHDSTLGQHRLHFSRSGGAVSVQPGARLQISAGIVIADENDPFTDSVDSTDHVAIENNATLQLSGAEKKIAELSGSNASAVVQLGAKLSIFNASDSTYAGRLQGSRSVLKSGPGALHLTGNSTGCTSAFTVEQGTLVASNAISSTGSGTVTVTAGGTLAGNGRIEGNVIVAGELQPGAVPFMAGDNLLETGALTLSATSILRLTLTGTPGGGDALSVSGDLTLNGGSVYAKGSGAGLAAGDVVLVTYSGTLVGSVDNLTLRQAPGGFSAKLLHDAGSKAVVLRLSAPPVSTLVSPVASAFRAATWPGQISGTVNDTNGLGIAAVEVSLRKSGGAYFSGTAFDSANEVWIPTLLTGNNWSIPFPVSNFDMDGPFTVRARATDNGQNFENPPAQRAFSIDRIAPGVTVTPLATQSAAPALGGTVNDPDASIVITLNGHSAPAVNQGNTWSLAAGTLPGLMAGTYDVAVTATDAAGNAGTDATQNELTVQLPNITISQLAPGIGTAAGGTLVTLSGTQLDLVTAVRFGVAAGILQSQTAGTVTVLTPEHDAGAVPVTVESLSNNVLLPNAFTYFNPPPSITSITPGRVSTNGSSLFTVHGGGFLNGADVQVNGKSSSEVVRVSSKQLTVRAPANPPGFAPVTVVNPDRNAVSLPNALIYDQPPQLTSVPQLNAGQVQVNSPVQLLFGLADPEGGAVSYSIDWGDGSTPGVSTLHTYTDPGAYTLTITATDGIGTSVYTLAVLVTGAGGVAPDPDPPGTTLQIDSFTASVRFDSFGKDSLQIKGLFPALPAGVLFADTSSTLNVGGVVEIFSLDAKGKAKSASASLTLRGKFVRDKATRAYTFAGGQPAFQIKAKGHFSATWADEGVAADGASGVPLPFLITLALAGAEVQSTVNATGKVNAGKSGKYGYKR